MGIFLKIYITKAIIAAKIWNDTFVLWPWQKGVQILPDYLNSIRPYIQLTMEKEYLHRLSFLGILITHTEQRFSSSLFQKPTFTGQYLYFNFHHTYNVNKEIIRCVQHRSKVNSSVSDVYKKEMNNLRENLHRTNYPESITSAQRNLHQPTENNTWKLTIVCLPNIKQKIFKYICSPHDIRTIFRSCSTLQKYLSDQATTDMTKNCLYSISCNYGKGFDLKSAV